MVKSGMQYMQLLRDQRPCHSRSNEFRLPNTGKMILAGRLKSESRLNDSSSEFQLGRQQSTHQLIGNQTKYKINKQAKRRNKSEKIEHKMTQYGDTHHPACTHDESLAMRHVSTMRARSLAQLTDLGKDPCSALLRLG
jgi:hypothetical protein